MGTYISCLECLEQLVSRFCYVVNEREDGVVALHLPIAPLKTRSELEPVPFNPLAGDCAT